MLRGWAGFFTGCLSAFFGAGKGQRSPAYRPWVVGMAMLLFLQLKTGPRWNSAIYFLTAGFIGALALSPQGLFHRLLEDRVLIWLCTISYSVYMSQAAVRWLLGQALRSVIQSPAFWMPKVRRSCNSPQARLWQSRRWCWPRALLLGPFS